MLKEQVAEKSQQMEEDNLARQGTYTPGWL